jgi:hypothetical protein
MLLNSGRESFLPALAIVRYLTAVNLTVAEAMFALLLLPAAA